MKRLMCITTVGAFLLATACEPVQQWTGQTFALDTPQPPDPAFDNPLTASPGLPSELGLVNILVDQLGIDSQQARGGVGSIFALAQQHMNPGDFMQLSGSVPGMARYLSSVPLPTTASGSWLGSTAGLVGEEASGLGSLTALAGSFQTLGMNADMISRFVPVVLQYVQEQSGPAAMNLLQNALY